MPLAAQRKLIETIARRSGMSTKTVRNVLNPRQRVLYRAETQERILVLAKEVGYRLNASARALIEGRFRSIGLLLSLASQRSQVAPGLLGGIEHGLSQRDLQLTLARLPDAGDADPTGMPKLLRELVCDGLLVNFIPTLTQPAAAAITACGLPVIWINDQRADNCVHPDDEGGARDLTAALMVRGHRRLAWLDSVIHHSRARGDLHYSREARRRGVFAAAAAAGITPAIVESTPGQSPVTFVERVQALLRSPDRPTAIIAYGGEELIAVEVAARLGLSLPRDVVIASFAHEGMQLSQAFYGMVYSRIPDHALGFAAVDMLDRIITAPRRRQLPLAVPFMPVDPQTVAPAAQG